MSIVIHGKKAFSQDGYYIAKKFRYILYISVTFD